MSDALSRRRFLATTAGAIGVIPILSACGGGAPTTAAACEGYDALSEADLATRAALNYVDKSPKPAEICASCRLYNAPAAESACGGCQLFAGPVTAAGYCTGWAAMQSA